MSGGYYGGWDPTPFLNNPKLDFPTTHYKTAKGRDYMDFGEWAGKLGEKRDETLKGIYFSARMMKYNPMATKDLKKSYSMVASAALRAMTPEGKFNAKWAMMPYRNAKKGMAAEVAVLKNKLGYASRKNLIQRIGYWNALRQLPMNDPNVLPMLSGVIDGKVKARKDFKRTGAWDVGSYPEYRAKLKQQMQAMRDKINTMTPTEYLAYQTRSRAIKDYRKALSGKRDSLMDAWKKRGDVSWNEIDSALVAPDSAAILGDTLKSSNNYKGLTAEMLNPYLKSNTGMMDAYIGTIDGFKQRPTPAHEAIVPFKSEKYAPLSLTSRGPADFKALAAQDVEMHN